MELKGYYNGYSYMGMVDNRYIAFATENEYQEYIEEIKEVVKHEKRKVRPVRYTVVFNPIFCKVISGEKAGRKQASEIYVSLDRYVC